MSQSLRWRNDPEIYRWTRQNGPLTYAEHEAWGKKLTGDPTTRMLGIEVEDDREGCFHRFEPPTIVGLCGLTSISQFHRSAEFSLYIGKPYQKRGYGKVALQELLKLGFMEYNLNCIWGESLEGNPAIEMFLKLGFKEEGWVRQRYFKEDKYQDAIIVSMLRSEFYKLKGEW